MIKQLLRAIIVCTLMAINLTLLGSIFFVFAAIKICLPKRYEYIIYTIADQLYHLWVDINYWIFKTFLPTRWEVIGDGELDSNTWYMLTANHCSGIDILILQSVFNRTIPHLKFFMKDSLKWIPFAGQACYVLDYPLIKRYSPSEIRKNKRLIAKNKENVRTACRQLKKHPTTVVNFLEGTRNKGNKQEASPYAHLLPPQAGGTAEVLQILDPEIQTLLDVTLCYKKRTTLVDFALGKVPKITVHYKKVPLDASWRGDFYTDRAFRADIAKKLNALWQEKDNILSTWHTKDQRTKILIVKLTSF